MHAISSAALQAALDAGADYADVRLLTETTEYLAARRGQVAAVALDEQTGIGIRVLAGGAWGRAASQHLDTDSLAAAARLAVANARACAPWRVRPVELAPEPAVTATWATPFRRAPESVPLDEKLELLVEVVRRAQERAGVAVTAAVAR
ncbi:MAG TPA: TldD protein, partial [Armatimonadetes bacterium]|nr:TldD protein [Armatimonadota bacterium]